MAEQEAPRTAQLMRENQRLRQQLYECRSMLRTIFIRNLIEDSVNPIHTSNLSSQLEKNGVVLPYPDVMVCTLAVIGLGSTSAEGSRHPATHEEFNQMRDTILLVCGGMLNAQHICYSADAGTEILLLVNFHQPPSGISPRRRWWRRLPGSCPGRCCIYRTATPFCWPPQ